MLPGQNLVIHHPAFGVDVRDQDHALVSGIEVQGRKGLHARRRDQLDGDVRDIGGWSHSPLHDQAETDDGREHHARRRRQQHRAQRVLEVHPQAAQQVPMEFLRQADPQL